MIIGIFDNDSTDCQEFGRLHEDDFRLIDSRTKKHKSKSIYAIKLPIPQGQEFSAYIQEKQEFKFFEIEHYFPYEFLDQNNMIKPTSIPGVNEIKDTKTNFSEYILTQNDPNLFLNYITLFNEIDSLTKEEYNYIE